MTSLCTVFGSVPLLLASGAGALSRQSIGAVVFFGVSFAMVLTLIVIPSVYIVVARNSHSPEYIGQMIDKLSQTASKAGEAG
jgi:Cu/Ag efflux pump CusA